MPHQVSASALIAAPPAEVYAIIADYHNGHPRIIPKPPFESIAVEQGGIGAGTVIRVGMRAFGRAQSYRATISEPEPGRVLVESNDTGYVTTFTVDPRDGGASSSVTITTRLDGRSGILAALERWFLARILGRVFRQELALLEAVATEK